MTTVPDTLHGVGALLLVLFAGAIAQADGPSPGWNVDAAAKYLDDRQTIWFTDSKCVSCHTVLPYALGRSTLRKFSGTEVASPQERALVAQTQRRVTNWTKLDSPEFGLYYDSSEILKKQSWGTEAVFNALILAFDDRHHGRSVPEEVTAQAFAILWEQQTQTGNHKGTWEWLDFNEEPWGSRQARYFGATLAAIAVGTAPGYYKPGADAVIDGRVTLLRTALQKGFENENLHNRTWALWAATSLDGILTPSDRKQVVHQLLDKQQSDGGWSLASLGSWIRNDGTAQDTASDGYATGLILHVLQSAGVPKDDAKISNGLGWLKRQQTESGAWRSVSLVKQRDPVSHSGKFMSDAATAFAVLALSH